MKILIVEDEPTSRAILTQILKGVEGTQVTVAESGQQAWELLDDASRSFDVVFLDLEMPKLNGFDLLRRIRAAPLIRSIHVVICTASKDRESVVKAIELGTRHYIVKPFTEELVRAKLQQLRSGGSPSTERRLAGA